METFQAVLITLGVIVGIIVLVGVVCAILGFLADMWSH